MKRKIMYPLITFALAAFIGMAVPVETVKAEIPKDYYYELLTDMDQRMAYTAYKDLLNGPYLDIQGGKEARMDMLTEEELKACEAEGKVISIELENKSLTKNDLPELVTSAFEAITFEDPMNVKAQVLSMAADAAVSNGTLYVGYTNPPSLDLADMQKQADAKKTEIVKAIKADSRYRDESPVEELLVHDYLCKDMKYDGASASGDGDRLYVGHTVYAAMVEKNAVCDAISMACSAILKDLGVDCYVVGGDAHAWNIVALDDGLYELDCTWDMASLNDNGRTEHKYFNKTTGFMTETEHYRDLFSSNLPTAEGGVYTYEKVMSDLGVILGEYTADGIKYFLEDTMTAIVKGLENPVKKIVIPSTLKVNDSEYAVSYIERQAFMDTGLKTVTIPESVAMIGQEAFKGCKKLKTVIIKDASYLQFVEAEAFQNTPKKIVFKIYGDRESFKKLKNALKDSGVKKGVYRNVK